MAKIPENVLNVLGECRADGNLLYLPSVQLDRKTYTEVNKVLENMGGKWNRKTKAHVFAEDDDVAEMLENVMLTQEVKDLKREYQFFPTPRAVAERMCEMAEIDSTSEVLEPSCGNGQLADVIWEHLPAGMCCIELNTDMKRHLSEKPYGVSYRDFSGRDEEGNRHYQPRRDEPALYAPSGHRPCASRLRFAGCRRRSGCHHVREHVLPQR